MSIKSCLCKKHGYSIPSTSSGGRCLCASTDQCPFDDAAKPQQAVAEERKPEAA